MMKQNLNAFVKFAIIVVVAFFAFTLMSDKASAQATDDCTVAAGPKHKGTCNNSCDLSEYFQYIFLSSATRPFCTSIPAAFWTYQTQVGEVSSGGKSSAGSASAGSVAASSSGGAATGAMTMTPSERVSAGAMVLRYASGAADAAGSEAINEEMSEDDVPPLEKGIWVKLLGTIGSKNATANLASVKIESGGLMAGMDIYSNEYFRVGLLGSVANVAVAINENNNEFDVLALKGGVTATLEVGKWYLDGLGTYGIERTKTSRTVDVNNNGNLWPMWSKFTNKRISAVFESGFRLTSGRVVIQPLAGVEMNWLMQDEVLEQGNASAAVLTDKNTTMIGSTKLGLNLSSAFVGDYMSIVPTIGGYWSHRFGELSNASRISTNQGSSYEYVGAKPPLNVANIYASVMANLNENVALSAGYSAAFNSIERNHTGTVGLRVRW
ncbi:autotransporter outer membrane beta-barrel domain-containing protein [Cohaesibacter celericrescens]|uniref:Autotransporter domain-containing protein n=1 Tax=Cohaesibacter celericrescens TaxID=2067669 RepID=A0A2N5XQQ1_9HYPH|nr:autotransporter outer membrane beta-barrel domain-containing protein [Cohaesibacter celericrescens]PLW76767.1 hypothetical protein C0081_11920 [Cohaesibacter celericrescens]